MARVTAHPVLVASAVRGLAASVQALLPNVDVLEIALYNEKGTIAEEQMSRVATRSVCLCDPNVVKQLITRSDHTLKWIQSTWAGVEGIMSLVRDKKLEPNCLFTRTGRGYGQLIGEYVVGHVIAHERRFKDMFRGNESKHWDRSFIKFRPLTSLTIGILGLGHIGKEIARLCKGMGMTVWGLSRGQRSQYAHVDQTRGPADLTSLLSNCDYVCNILPSTPETRGLLSGDVLSSCKEKQAVLINVGRGDVVSEESLVNALKQGWIGGAILDVFAEEPLPESSPLWSMSNVTITPHCSGPCLPSQVAEGFVENYNLFCNGYQVKYQVDWTKGY